jgi:predicted phage-related endonuclease
MNDTTTKGRVQMTSTAVRTTTTEIVVSHTVVHLDQSADAVIKEFAKAKEDMKVLEAKKKAAEEKIRQLLGDAKLGFIDGVKRVEIKDRTLTKVDRKILQAAYPEAYEASLVSTEYTIVDAE